MSVDAILPVTVPPRVRPRFRGDTAAVPSPTIPILLRVPDVRPRPVVVPAPAESAAAALTTVASTSRGDTELAATPAGCGHTETSTGAGENRVDPTGGRKRVIEINLDSFSLASMKGRTLEGLRWFTQRLRWFAQKWAGQARTVGAIAFAVVACGLVVKAMQQDHLDPAPGPQHVRQSEADEADLHDQAPIQAASHEGLADHVAAEQNPAGVADEEASMSRVPESPRDSRDAEAFYANSPYPPQRESVQPSDHSAEPAYGAHDGPRSTHYPQPQETGGWRPETGGEPEAGHAASGLPPTGTQRWGSPPPTHARSGYTGNQWPHHPGNPGPPSAASSPQHQFSPDRGHHESSPAASAMSPGFPSASPGFPSASTVPSAPTAESYPTTDPSRYGSFRDLKTALQERKLSHGQPWRADQNLPWMHSEQPGDAPAASGANATSTYGGAYR